MRLKSIFRPAARDPSRVAPLWLLLTLVADCARAVSFNAVPSPNLDFSQLGRVGLAGDFNGISLYEFEGQSENGFSTNGSQSILGRLPNGGFAPLVSADASIRAMCNFVMSNGVTAGLIVAGNFTSLGGLESQGVALYNPDSSTVVPLPGLSGQVSALLCDKDTNSVYVGGSFRAANSTNAIAWVGTAGWTTFPFLGFNGPVTSITKAANGHIIFGGSFTGLGNASAPNTPDQQVINLSGSKVTSGATTSTSGFNDPRNVICKTSGTDGAGNTWLLADNTPGFWRADLGFGFQPTKLRLWNTHQDGRGARTWRYTAKPINGIMNFTYTDPATGQLSSCSSECPLSNDTKVSYQDFHFVNVIGMNAFQIDISAWYGDGGGLNGIELFENDIFSFAVNDFNEPTCANIPTASTATTTGPWTVSPSLDTESPYLSVTLTGSVIDSNAASVVFLPDIKQSGNYSVNIYTPGCMQDNTCSSRGRVNITGIMASGTTFQTEIFQTNNFNKYDQIYFGYIEAGSGSFRPSVKVSPSLGQSDTLTVVAQRVGFTLIESSGGLNSIFDWDPSLATVNTSDFATSKFDLAGMSLGHGQGVTALVTTGSTTFIGGNFSTAAYDNIFAVNTTGSVALAGGGLNSGVLALYANGTKLYVGGNFTSTSKSASIGLNHVAAYDISANSWSSLGNGVNGRVCDIVPLSINMTGSPVTVITLSGNFDQILAFGAYGAISVSGFAVWVPSQMNWLQNLNVTTISISGTLSATVDLTSGGSLVAGSLTSSQLGVSGAVSLTSGIKSFPIKIQPSTQSSSGLSKRATTSQNISGVVTGLFYEAGGRNVTVLGGHFSAIGTGGSPIHNLAFINGSNSDAVTGVGSQLSDDSTVLALATQGDVLFAGGALTGTVNGSGINGIMSFDLRLANFNTQPPALSGTNVAVYSLAIRPNTAELYVGGNFGGAGKLDCPGVCLFDTTAGQWHRPGGNLGGTVNAMTWASANSLIVAGSLAIGANSTSLAMYDAVNQVWSVFDGSAAIPGPITSLTPATSDYSQLWVAGTATNGSTFLMKYDGSKWTPAGSNLGTSTTIRGLQMLPLTQGHDSTTLIPSNQVLMLTGALSLPTFGNASAVIFNGTTFQPFALTSSSSSSAGSLSQIFSQQQNYFGNTAGHLALGFVVLIGLAISLALIFVIVIAGILAERIRRKREGYVRAPTNMFDKTSQMSRIPPEQIFGSVGQSRSGAPMI